MIPILKTHSVHNRGVFKRKLQIGILAFLWVILGTGQVALAKGGQRSVICIDPGHISDFSEGTRGKHITEVHANYLVAVELEKILLQLGYRVVMTKKSESQVVSNKVRAAIANNAHAQLFLRLHCDAGSGSGFAFYVPTQPGKTKSGVRGPNYKVIYESQVIGRQFYKGFVKGISRSLKDNGFNSDLKTGVGSKQGALTGSIYSKVPVVLVEMVVLTNPKDERFIISSKGRKKIVESLAEGIEYAIPAIRNESKTFFQLFIPCMI